VLAEVTEDVAAEHAAKAEAEPVVEAEGRAVEHLPEPDEGLANGVLFGVDVAVVLGLECSVARVEAFGESVDGELVVEGRLRRAAIGPAKIELDEFVADDLGADLGFGVASEFVVEASEPATVDCFGFRARLEFAVHVCGHWVPFSEKAYSMAKTA
jgi:hypothetical protein